MTTHEQRMGATGTPLDPERAVRPLRARPGSEAEGGRARRQRGSRPPALDLVDVSTIYANVYDGAIEDPDLYEDDPAEAFRDPWTTFDKWFIRIMAAALALVIFAAIAGWLR